MSRRVEETNDTQIACRFTRDSGRPGVGSRRGSLRDERVGAGRVESNTEVPKPAFRVARIESVRDVTMKRTAEIVVAFDKRVAEPRGPNAVWEPIPPNAPARSAAFPLCSKTTIIRKIQTITWTISAR